DDCLMPGAVWFEGKGSPLDASGQIALPIKFWSLPLGPATTMAVLTPVALGGSLSIMRRAAFEAVGGYREIYGAGCEDWELTIRLALAGFRVEVLPEYLHLYRVGDSQSLSHVNDLDASGARMLETYESHLGAHGLDGLAEWLWAYGSTYQEGAPR